MASSPLSIRDIKTLKPGERLRIIDSTPNYIEQGFGEGVICQFEKRSVSPSTICVYIDGSWVKKTSMYIHRFIRASEDWWDIWNVS